MNEQEEKVSSFGRDVSTHALALLEIKRLSEINLGLVNDHNTLLLSGSRQATRLGAATSALYRVLDHKDATKELKDLIWEGLRALGR
jgi:hypothetical protein